MSNLVETLPITSRDRLTAVETAVTADETGLGQTATSSFCDISLTALATPLNVVVTQGGTAGSTAYTYVVADVGNAGTSAPATGVATSTGALTLSTTNFNIVTWASLIGHTYNVYRSASSGTPSGTGLIGSVTATSLSATLSDTGITGTGNVPTANTTGAVVPAGPIFGSSLITQGGSVPTVSTSGNATLTVSQMRNRLLVRNNNTSALSDTTPSAAAFVAALPGIKANTVYTWSYRNDCTTSATVTIVGGSGVTLAATNTNTIAVGHTREFFIIFVNVTPGSEAVTIYSGPDSAH